MALRSYEGSCHCGSVRFTARVDLASTVVCNCSLCRMRGFIWAFTARDNLRVVAGSDQLVTYRFHERVIEHRLCRVCGIEPFALSEPEAGPTAMIDARCLTGVDFLSLPPPARYDGAAR